MLSNSSEEKTLGVIIIDNELKIEACIRNICKTGTMKVNAKYKQLSKMFLNYALLFPHI